MLTILDVNNFWSPSGGGVRRYHLEKLKYMTERDDVFYIFAMSAKVAKIEIINETTVIAHIPAPKIPGNWEYRYSISKNHIRKIVEKYKPDIIEVGSPYIMPFLIRRIVRKCSHKPKIYGFWHADFPITYVNRFFMKFGRLIANFFTSLAWFFARKNYGFMQAILVSSRIVGARLKDKIKKEVHFVPLGVDLETFGPHNRNEKFVKEIKAGKPERLTIFFPHRFCGEKGVDTLIQAYPKMCELLTCEPAIIFAGTGPYLNMVKEAAEKYEHIRYAGFINDPKLMAKYNASCELGFALSGWETFGLSIMEALASGQVLIGADTGGALEHISYGKCGLTLTPGNPEKLAQAVKQLVDENLFAELSQNAINYASNFRWEECFQKEIEIFQGSGDFVLE